MISVAMCTYNGEKFISKQLDSILAQTQSVDEIIICDDCSEDKTVAIVMEKLKISCVNYKIIKNDIRIGVTKNFQNAICNCSGDIIFLCDQDDVWKNNKVELIYNKLKKEHEILLVFTDADLIDENFSVFDNSLWETIKFKKTKNYSVLDFFEKRFVTGATVAFRKSLVEYIFPIPDCWIHDAWLAVNASVYGKVVSISEKTIYYRLHSSNTIGLQRGSIIIRIKKRWDKLDASLEFRLCMAERVKSFMDLNGNKLSDIEKGELEKSYLFWMESYMLKEQPCFKALKIILKNIFNGNYKKFNHGLFGVAVDLCIRLRKIGVH